MPIEVIYKEAYVGCWTLYDKGGKPIYTCRYGEMPVEEAHWLLEESLGHDLQCLLDGRPDLLLVTLGDGAPEMQNMLRRICKNLDVKARLVDFWHAVEYLAPALRALELPVDVELPKLKRALLQTQNGAHKIVLKLRSWAIESERSPCSRSSTRSATSPIKRI